jgi:hypothetical protein
VDPVGGLSLVLPLAQHHGGGSGSFRAVASDNRRWFVKPPNQLQGGHVLVSEYVVASVGQLLGGAATCESSIIEIPPAVAGWEFRPGLPLVPGFGHASLEVETAQEVRGAPSRPGEDDNRRRQAGLAAVYDLCWGADEQYLHAVSDDWKIYSHDHGHYFPGGPQWTQDSLRASVTDPHTLGITTVGADADALEAFAVAVESLQRESLVEVLNGVPASWAVLDEALATLGWFIEERRVGVAQRLRGMTGGTTP